MTIIAPTILRLPKRVIQDDKLQDRFWSKTEKDGDGCLVWIGHIDKYGYGKFKYDGRPINAHRMALLLSGYTFNMTTRVHALHCCPHMKRHCIEHVYLGSVKDNMRDAAEDGTMGKKGEDHANAVLREKDVLRIRRLIAAGRRLKDIAAEYGVVRATIHSIGNRVTWSHI